MMEALLSLVALGGLLMVSVQGRMCFLYVARLWRRGSAPGVPWVLVLPRAFLFRLRWWPGWGAG